MKLVFVAAVLALGVCVGLAGCSGGGGSGGTPPNNAEQALQKLSPQHRATFEAWKNKVVKSCDVSAAFGTSQGDQSETGVDSKSLLEKNHHSMVVRNENEFLILNNYDVYAGVTETSANESSSVNGQSTSISVSTKRSGDSCTVYAFGQPVYETTFAKSFQYSNYYSNGATATASAGLPQMKPIGRKGAYQAERTALKELLDQLTSSSKDSSLISDTLGVTENEAARFFKATQDRNALTNSTRLVAANSGAVWSQNGGLIANEATLKNLFDGSSKTFKVEVLLPVREFRLGSETNTGDTGSLRLTGDVDVSLQGQQGNSRIYLYTAKSFKFEGVTPFDPAKAQQCLTERAEAFEGDPGQFKMIWPTTEYLLNPCTALDAKVLESARASGFMKTWVPRFFAGVRPAQDWTYGGWESELETLVYQTLNAGKDISAELDPKGIAPVISYVDRYMKVLQAEMAKAPAVAAVKGDVQHLAIQWSLLGLEVSESFVAEMMRAIAISVDPFMDSTRALIWDIASSPNHQQAALDFAKAITPEYKAKAVQALNLAEELNYKEFKHVTFGRVLQNQVSASEFQSWIDRLTAIKSEINKYSHVGRLRGELVAASIEWLKAGSTTTQDLSAIYQSFDNTVEPFDESSQAMLRDARRSLSDSQAALAYARALTPEYKQLAVSIRDSSKAAEYESWGREFFNSVLQKRPSLDQVKAWNDLWTSATAFIARDKARAAGETGFPPEWARKKVLDKAVAENWSSAEFAGLESIAPVASAKNTCDRYKAASSLADCAGLENFSKQNGKFFDPKFGGRYTPLGADFVRYLGMFPGSMNTTFRWDLVNAFFGSFGPLWGRCESAAFEAKRASLNSQITEYSQTSDQSKKWELERKIKETFADCSR